MGQPGSGSCRYEALHALGEVEEHLAFGGDLLGIDSFDEPEVRPNEEAGPLAGLVHVEILAHRGGRLDELLVEPAGVVARRMSRSPWNFGGGPW
jgi:hypothetical protein